MKAQELEGLESFALLGPGFGAGGFLLLKGLRPASRAENLLVFAPFETPGEGASGYAAASTQVCELELPEPGPGAAPLLEARDYGPKLQAIRRAIARGEVYQVCLCLKARLAPQPGSSLLARLCRGKIPPYCAWVRLPGGREFVSASPELFFEVRGRSVRSQPMKGTAAPGSRQALEASPKDRAELAMITDLLRNDLAPVCRPGSLRVSAERRLLRLPYAWQAVSEIEGELAPGRGPLQVLAALHPGGSVTGAPKRAALRMLGELEEGPRGAYCGALGLCRGGEAVFSLLIRTAEKTEAGWDYGVGSGVVWESEEARELEELRTKLGMLR